jgi:hypothetical protein
MTDAYFVANMCCCRRRCYGIVHKPEAGPRSTKNNSSL